jgi:hypothetical protein
VEIPLAPYCKKREKAFGPGTYGTVLGINFDSKSMTWNLGAEKEAAIQDVIHKFLEKPTCTLLEAQKLHGKLSDFALMCDFMLGFRFHIVELLAKFGTGGKPEERKIIPHALKEDLWTWKKTVAAARLGFPIRNVRENPPIDVITLCPTRRAPHWNGSTEQVKTLQLPETGVPPQSVTKMVTSYGWETSAGQNVC